MSLIEVLVIALASGLEIASIVICKGAMLSQISKEKIGKLLLIMVGWNLVTILIGNALAYPLINWSKTSVGKIAVGFFLILIFVALAIAMLLRSFRNNFMEEVCNDTLKWSDTWRVSSIIGVTGVLVGFGFGLIETNIVLEVIAFAVSSAIAVVAGLFIGYRFGYQPKRKGYIFSAILLTLIDIDLIIDFIHKMS